MSGRDPNDDVQELKNELRRHDTRIEELQQQLQQDRYCSTMKIKELEDEKKSLENKVNELELKIKWLEDDGQKKNARIDSMEENLTRALHRIDLMGEEIHFFVKKSQDQEKVSKTDMAKTDELKKSRNILEIGQLCANVMEEAYREVLPDYFERDDYKQPHLNRIDEEIEHRYGKKSEQKEAKKKWRKVLQGEEIDENMVMKLVDFMEKKLEERNVEAHPSPLIEDKLKGIASNLPGQEQQYFEKLIQIYFHQTK